MNTIKIKALSVNRAFQGRRFKTPIYIAYEREMLYLLPKSIGKIPEKIELHYVFGVSSKSADVGNLEKLATDILCKKYGFNDKNIYKIVMEREDVEKGKEFVAFEISEWYTKTN